MSEYRRAPERLLSAGRYLRRRGWSFWIVSVVLAALIAGMAVLYPEDRKGERAYARLTSHEAVAADTVLWHVKDGYLEDVAVVLPLGDDQTFTLDLTGVDGDDEVSSNDGWQPAHRGDGADHYAPGMLVRYDLSGTPVGMAEYDRSDFSDDPSQGDLIVLLLATVVLTAMVGWTVRKEVLAAPARRRTSVMRQREAAERRRGRRPKRHSR